MASLNPSPTFWKPAVLPLFTGLLALVGAADGIANLVKPDIGAAMFGLVPPPPPSPSPPTDPDSDSDSDSATPPARFEAFHHALVKVKGARNLHMSSCILALVLYGQFSAECRASPLAARAVRRCVGVVLALGSGVGFSGAAVVYGYIGNAAVASSSDEAVRVGRQKARGHLIANVPIIALAAVYLFT